MADPIVGPGDRPANPEREPVSPPGIDENAGTNARAPSPRRDDMNMMTSIEVAPASQPRKLFLNERREPSDRSGPDLNKARPIEDVMRELGYARNGFWQSFLTACRDSGINLSVERTNDGEDRLLFGCAMDSQAHLRQPRLEALMANLRKYPHRRQQIIDVMNMYGRFVDNQPFATAEEAVECFLNNRGRVMIRPDGQCEHTVGLKGDTWNKDSWTGYSIRRAFHRFEATLRQSGMREQIIEIVRHRGELHAGSGWIVLEAKERQDA